jgi:hypothetical protein
MLRPKFSIESYDIRNLCAHPTQYIHVLWKNVATNSNCDPNSINLLNVCNGEEAFLIYVTISPFEII